MHQAGTLGVVDEGIWRDARDGWMFIDDVGTHPLHIQKYHSLCWYTVFSAGVGWPLSILAQPYVWWGTPVATWPSLVDQHSTHVRGRTVRIHDLQLLPYPTRGKDVARSIW